MTMSKIQKKMDSAVRGLNILFTGNGKGKTSAAMGILARAAGRNLAVGVIQFIKSSEGVYGEAITAKKLGIPFQSMGDGFVRNQPDQKTARIPAMAAWEEAKKWIVSYKYDVLILDEVTYLFHFKWLDVNEFISWVSQNKPVSMHLVMTGRYAPPELIEFADLVTEMREVKHPFNEQGVPAQLGIDY